MIVELALAAAGTYAYNYLNSVDERKFKSNFNKIMIGTGIKNKEEETFKIYKIEPKSYGYIAYINIPKGLSLDHLTSKLNILEDNLNGIIQFEKDKFKSHITMRIVDKDIAKFKFVPAKCPTHLLWIGRDFKGEDYFLDLNKDPHVLIGGVTGTGKSFLLASILTNLIYNYPRDVDIYLSQIVKGEIGAFAECQPVKFVAYNMAEVMISLNKVCKILDDRSKLFMDNGIRNITQWNTHFKFRRMKRIIYVLEELSFFMDQPEVWGMILKVVKAGRSVGIHIISCVQRSTATNLPPDVKSQMTRITFRQKSYIDSVNIINTSEATKLKERECIVDGNSDTTLVKVPWIDEDYILLHQYVPEIKIPTKQPNDVIVNVNKENNQIITIESPIIIDVEEDQMKPVRKRKRKGVISLQEVQNADRKR